jgi:hypothetical protein
MKISILSRMRLFLALVALAIFAVIGCDDKSSGPDRTEPGLTIWLGSNSDTGGVDSGAIMLDLIRNGRKVSAEAVIRSRVLEYPFDHIYFTGTADGDYIQLHLDTDRMPYDYEFDIQLTVGSGGTLEGSFYHSAYGMTADLECAELESADATADTFIDVRAVTLGLAFDGEHIWISTSGRDYFIMDSTAAIVDTIAVLFETDMHWTSDALTSDGTLLWGGFPVTVTDPDGSRNESDIIEFTKDGSISRRFRIGHRTSGLAWSGEDLWSISIESDLLYRLGLDGSVLQTVTVDVPDLVDIAFDGEYFWAIGWFFKRLYKISGAGDVLTVYHLPGEHTFVYPAGLAFDGSHFWYNFDTSYLDSRIYRLSVE